jgi:hypothetical protein
MKKTVITVLILLLTAPLAWSEDGPRTGYFRKALTPIELLGAALPWGDNLPPKIDLIRQNNYLFMVGGLDDDRRKMSRAAQNYRDAGVSHVDFLQIPNVDRQMPGSSHFEQAVKFLDSGEQTSPETE